MVLSNCILVLAEINDEKIEIEFPAGTETCIKSIETKIRVCQRDAKYDWGILQEDVIFGQSDDKTYCCAVWDVIECVHTEARRSEDCNETELELIYSLFEDMQNQMESGRCNSPYQKGSYRCIFPLWGTLLCFLAFILGTGGVAFFLFYVLKLQPN